MPEEGGKLPGVDNSTKSFLKSDKAFDLVDAPQQNVEDFDDVGFREAKFRLLERVPQPKEVGRGVVVISEVSGVMKLHVKTKAGVVKSITLT